MSQQRHNAAQQPSPFGTHGAPAATAGTHSPAARAAGADSPYRSTPLLGHGLNSAHTSARLPLQRHLHNATAHTASTAGPPRVSTSAAAAASQPAAPALLPLPESEMSCHALLSLHLDDYVSLVQSLFDSLDPAQAQSAAATTAGSHAAAALATPVTAAASGAGSSDLWMRKLLRKDALLQESVEKLLAHQRLQRRLQAQYAELAELDSRIISFCSRLASIEGRLLAVSTDDSKLGALPSSLAGPVSSHAFSLRSLLLMSENLARMSMPPSDHIEKKTTINEHVCRPPAPLEKYMAHSLLRLDIEELTKLVEAEAKAKRDAEQKAAEDAAAEKDAVAAMDDSMRAEIGVGVAEAGAHMAGSLAALGRQDAPSAQQPGFPSFAELSAAGNGAAGAPQGTPGQMWRHDSAQRPRPTAAPVALDLDLESSDEEDEDD